VVPPVDLVRHCGCCRCPTVCFGEIGGRPYALLRHIHAADHWIWGHSGTGARHLVVLVVNAQVLNGVITPLLLTYILILANRSTVLAARQKMVLSSKPSPRCVRGCGLGLLSFVVLIQTVFGLG